MNEASHKNVANIRIPILEFLAFINKYIEANIDKAYSKIIINVNNIV